MKQNLKSADEMEEEERAAQSAKLQELIRRGGPADLQEANRLMKVMAGYDTRNKTDYRAKAAEEVGKIQQKARLLEERLEEFKPGDKMEEGDVYEELASALQSAHPKIQKMCEEESDDHEAVAKLLEINDSIHRTVERYKLMKKGDVAAAAQIAKGTLGTSTGVSRNADNELSLIDFDAGTETNGGSSSESQPSKTPGGLDDDLLGLSMGDDSTFGQGGGISLGFGTNSSKNPSSHLFVFTDEIDIPGPALISSTMQANTAKGPTPSASPAPAAGLPKPNYSAFNTFGSPQPSQAPAQLPTPLQQQQPAPKAIQQPASDPFAALNTPLRQTTPLQNPPPSASKSLFDFAQPATPKTLTAPAHNEDEWDFSSATLPENDTIPVLNTNIKVDLRANRTSQSDPVINLEVMFSNNTAQPVSELTFQVAVTKV